MVGRVAHLLLHPVMKKDLSLAIASLLSLALPATAATIGFVDGNIHTSNASGPIWVGGSTMYTQFDTGEASGSSQSGFAIFDGGYDITLLSWEFTGLSLMGVGVGDSVTQSPTLGGPGYEDYRYSGLDANLGFFYDGELWVQGRVTRFVSEVEHYWDFGATGIGWAVIEDYTAAGEDFYNAIGSLSGGTYQLTFYAYGFDPVDALGHFQSDGHIEVVPEPSTYAAIAGVLVLGFCLARRRVLGAKAV